MRSNFYNTPFSKTIILSASAIVERRCAIVRTVRPSEAFAMRPVYHVLFQYPKLMLLHLKVK